MISGGDRKQKHKRGFGDGDVAILKLLFIRKSDGRDGGDDDVCSVRAVRCRVTDCRVWHVGRPNREDLLTASRAPVPPTPSGIVEN